MKLSLTLLTLFASVVTFAASRDLDIPVDSAWKKALYQFSQNEFKHTAWGFQHFQRDYLVAKDLAKKENIAIDEEVLFAAAFTHDMGGFPKYAKEGVDHAVRSAEIVGDYILPVGFPAAKLPAVKAAILTHSYYCPTPPNTPEGTVLHDADGLDFLGDISIARILSITEREAAASSFSVAYSTLRALLKAAPASLVTKTARTMSEPRIAEMKTFLATLSDESFTTQAL